MRIVAVADTHLFHDDLVVPEGDVFVHAGDICRMGSLEELQRAAKWMHSLPHTTKIVIAGNHDWSFVRTPPEARAILGHTIHYLEDSGVTVDGVRFWGGPWQPEFGGWAFNLPRGNELKTKWALIPEGTDVLITHGPPRDIGDGTRGGYGGELRVGCDDLRARVRHVKPLLHLFGHIHDSGGLWSVDGTNFANVTTWECERQPSVVDLDLANRTVTSVEIPPARRA